MGGTRCRREGCRAWARRGWTHCGSHLRQAVRAWERRFPPENGAEPTPAGAAWVRGQWLAREMGMVEELARRLERGETEGLAAEIAAARVALARLLREEDDPVRLAEGVARAAGVIFKARQIEQRTGGEAAGALSGLAERILAELEADETSG